MIRARQTFPFFDMSTKLPPRTMAERIQQSACDRASDLLWNESMDDYAAAVVVIRDDGSGHVSIACAASTFDALRNASTRAIAERLADMRIPDEWTLVDCFPYERVQMRAISSDDGEVVGFLFKR